MQDTIFSRAKRGDLPSALPIPGICQLSTASLDRPLGAYSPGDDLAQHLRQLVTLGAIVPERSEAVSTPGMILGSIGGAPITTSDSTHMEHYIRAASLRPMLAELGEIGPLLATWIKASAGAAAEAAPATKATTPKRERWYVGRVTRFCTAVAASSDIDPDAPGFTAEALAEAIGLVGLWHRPGEPLPKTDTLRGYAAAVAAKWFVLPGGRPKGKDTEQRHRLEVGRLVALYRKAVPEENQEPGNRAPTVSASNFHRVAGG
ncbi:MAG: hypothetical protein JNK97_03550 [Zoogloea sp.]|nr:hypothetical protein [Zoogloea sp.]